MTATPLHVASCTVCGGKSAPTTYQAAVDWTVAHGHDCPDAATEVRPSAANDIVASLMADLEITYSGGHGGYVFTHEGTDYELVVDESFYADGDPGRHEARATIYTQAEDYDSDPVEVATVRITVDVIA